jgi:hypothetical protein
VGNEFHLDQFKSKSITSLQEQQDKIIQQEHNKSQAKAFEDFYAKSLFEISRKVNPEFE